MDADRDREQRAAKGTRVGRQEVQHTQESLDALAWLKRHWKPFNASDVVRASLERQARELGWKPSARKAGG